MKKVIIVEDDPDIAQLLKLKIAEKYSVELFASGRDFIFFIEQIKQNKDIVLFILDRTLPYFSGDYLCQFLRSHSLFKSTPIMMVTALSSKKSIVEGFERGVDDYLTKPFDLSELMARVNALAKRAQVISEEVMTLGALMMDLTSAKVFLSHKEINLTKTEYLILKELILNRDKVLSRDYLIKNALGDNVYVSTRTIDTHVVSLRKKIHPYGNSIEAVRGMGYRITHDKL